MIVVVAEKPSVGRDIARVLKCQERGEGFLKGEKYTVTWAVGHLVTLCEPDEMDEKYKKWRMEDLPILPENIHPGIHNKANTANILKNIRRNASRCSKTPFMRFYHPCLRCFQRAFFPVRCRHF